MLEVIGISAVRMTKRRNHQNHTNNRKFNFAEAINAVGDRRVAKAIETPVARTETKQKQGAYKLDEGIVYEVYDKKGNVTLRVPQKIDPVDEIA